MLWLGNSYTFVNNLPEIVNELSLGTDKIVTSESICPGGCTLFQHVASTTSLNAIRKGCWDYVVLQEQSQLPSIDYYRHNAMRPAYQALYDTIMLYNPEAKVVGYMTWGRKFGGQQCVNFGEGLYCSADFVDFNHMQDTMSVAYCENAYATNSYVAPAGDAWKEALSQNPQIELHSPDESHPSYDGSYLTACVFHSVFWNESPIGRYYDSTQGKYIFDESAPTAYSKNQWAVESYFNILQSIYAKGNGLLHKYSSEMTAMDAEAALAGFGYAGIDNKPVVFMVCGAYLEQEMNFLLQDQKASGNPQEIGYMQTPVASGIIERTPSIENDGVLRQVITYVDKIAAGESATKPAGVEDADIEIIAEARSICGSYAAGGMVIPKHADNIAGAKEFMKYLASDEAAIIAAKYCNGMNILPFGYQASDEEIGFSRTSFMKQAMAISTRVKYVATSDSQEYHFSKISKFGPAADGPWTYLGPLYNGTNKYTATSFYNAQYEKFSLNWKMYVDTYKAAGGEENEQEIKKHYSVIDCGYSLHINRIVWM